MRRLSSTLIWIAVSVLGAAALAETTNEISALADVLIEEALREIDAAFRSRYGPPQHSDAEGRLTDVPVAVLSLGKLGGNELNYSSDIDLMFVYGGNGETEGPSRITNKEFCKKVANQYGMIHPSHDEVYTVRTVFVVDPKTEKVALRWVGGATVAQLQKIGMTPPPGRGSLETTLDSRPDISAVYGETFYPRIHLGWSELRSVADARDHYIDGPEPELYDRRADAAEEATVVRHERPRLPRVGSAREDRPRLRLAQTHPPALGERLERDAAQAELVGVEHRARQGLVGIVHAVFGDAQLAGEPTEDLAVRLRLAERRDRVNEAEDAVDGSLADRVPDRLPLLRRPRRQPRSPRSSRHLPTRCTTRAAASTTC